MFNHEKDKNKIWEVIIVKGVKYLKDAVSSKQIIAQLALRGSKVNVISDRHISKKVGAKLYF